MKTFPGNHIYLTSVKRSQNPPPYSLDLATIYLPKPNYPNIIL